MAQLKFPAVLGWRFGLVILLLAVLSLLLGTQNALDVNENTRCLANYAKRQAEVSAIRGAATAQKDKAVQELLDRVTQVILDPRSPQRADTQLRVAAEKYRRESVTLQAKREANPLPGFPDRCSEVNQ